MSASSAKKRARAAARPTERLVPDAPLVRVAVLFFAIYAVLQTITWYLALRGVFDPVLELTARFTGACATVAGSSPVVSGNEVALASRILRIDLDCTGISLMTVYAALVLAYPLRASRRLIGLAAGIPAIWVANLLRLSAVAAFSDTLSDRTFLFVHDYLFKVVMVAVVIGLWAAYLASARRDAR